LMKLAMQSGVAQSAGGIQCVTHSTGQ
jgi:hypothetical protein